MSESVEAAYANAGRPQASADYPGSTAVRQCKGVDQMETHFTVSSATFAEKTKQLLSRYRFRFQVQKVTGSAGCAYQFTVSAEPAAVFALLTAQRIPYQTC